MSVDIDGDTREVQQRARLRKVGGSWVVSIPSELRELLDAQPGDPVTFAAPLDENGLRIRAAEKREEE